MLKIIKPILLGPPVCDLLDTPLVAMKKKWYFYKNNDNQCNCLVIQIFNASVNVISMMILEQINMVEGSLGNRGLYQQETCEAHCVMRALRPWEGRDERVGNFMAGGYPHLPRPFSPPQSSSIPSPRAGLFNQWPVGWMWQCAMCAACEVKCSHTFAELMKLYETKMYRNILVHLIHCSC